MAVQISINDKFYKSDDIKNGRIVKRFFKQLTTNVFKMSDKHSRQYQEIIGESEIPLLYGERNLYSLFASAVNAITPVHLSEWGFNKNDDNTDKNRRVDLWCLYKNSQASNPINFYIELKTGWYCLNSRSEPPLDKRVKTAINDLTDQLRSLNKIKPKWADVDDVYLGLMIIYGYYSEGNEGYTKNDLLAAIDDSLDARTVKNYLISTQTLPDDISAQWDKNKCRFISIVGIPIVT